MGFVRRQSIRSSVFIYLGFAIGAFNHWLLPNVLSTDQFGLVRVLLSVCSLLAGICSLGTQQVITRFYPYYEDERNNHKTDLLTWTLLISLVGYTLMVILTLVFKDVIIRKFASKAALFLDYFYLIYPFTLFILLFGLYERIAWSREFTVLSSFLREAGLRIFTSLIVIALALHVFGFNLFIILYSLQFVIVFLVLFYFLTFRKNTGLRLHLSNTTRHLYRHMRSYALYIYGGSVLIIIEQYFNTILLGGHDGLQTAGVFNLATFIATLLLVPRRSLRAAASATIARAWKEKDMGRIERVYKKSTATLLIAGLCILGLIWLNIDSLFDLYPGEYRAGKYVVLFIALGNLADLATGLNYDILMNSKIWKINFILNTVLIVFFLALTYWMVLHFGMMGSAYSIFISLAVYNIARCILIAWKFKMQPYTIKTLFIVVGALISYFIAAKAIPGISNIYLNVIIRSSIFFLLFAGMVIGGKLSEDISELFELIKVKLGLKKV